MTRRYSKKHLFWLASVTLILLLAAALAGGLAIAHLRGWYWQNLAWDGGPVLGRLAWHDGECPQLVARNIQLRKIWPVRLSIARLTVPSCGEGGGQRDSGFRLPAAPPFDVVVQSLQFQDYPAPQAIAHHRETRWWVQVCLEGSNLQAAYDAEKGRWQFAGRLDVTRLHNAFSGILTIQGNGYWHPETDKPDERFGGQLQIAGKHLGRKQRGPYADLATTVSWQGQEWTLNAALSQPLVLERDWVVQPGRGGLQASGTGMTVGHATAVLAVESPQAHGVLSLQSNAGHLDSGRGSLTLSHGVTGSIDLSWADDKLMIPPFSVTGPKGVVLTLNKAVAIPLTSEGTITPALSLRYGDAKIHTTESCLSWRSRDVRWHGAVAFGGRWQSYRLGGGWSGAIDGEGLHGKPLVATLDSTDLHLRARLPIAGLWPPDWPVILQLDGHFMGADFTAAISAKQTGAGWSGHLRARSRLPQMEQGGKMTLNSRWQWRDGRVLLAGARLSMARALMDSMLIRPITLTTVTPIIFNANGIQGQLHLDAEGLIAPRWALSPVQADITLNCWHFKALLRIPEWNSRLTVVGRDLAGTPKGTFNATLPLQPAISRSLAVITRNGVLTAKGNWRAGSQPAITSRLQARHVRLDWGSITASGIQADLETRWRPGSVRISSRVPLAVARLDAGVPVTGISLALDSDLHTWRLHDIKASLLGGRLTASELTWPSPRYQPVMLAGMNVAQLAALQSEPVITVSGQASGTIPLRLSRNTLAIRDGQLKNVTPLSLSIPYTDGVHALKESHSTVGVALDAISPLRIEEFTAHVKMSTDGWLKGAITIKGVNPIRKLPVILNYTHQENMFELLRSLRIGSHIINAIVMSRH